MSKRVVLFTSIFLSVLLLAIAGGVVKAVSARQQTATINADLQQQIDAREAEYAQAINQANQQIQQLNDQINLQSEPEKDKGISPEEAALIALQTTGFDQALLQVPELVSFEGNSAYEIRLTDGTIYVDSVSGSVLFNGVPERITSGQAAQIAGEYLGGMDPQYAVVKTAVSNGTEVFQVTFNNYVVYVDQFGNVLQAQVYQYSNTTETQNSSSNNQQASSYHDDDDHEHEEHEEYEQEHD